MDQFLDSPLPFLFLGLGLILLALGGVMAWATRFSFRINRTEAPASRILFLAACLQVLLGVGATLLLRMISNDPALDLGGGFGLALFSGLFLLKGLFKAGWKETLRLWGVAVLIQVLLVPVCALVLLGVFMLFIYLIFPPQF